MNNDEKLKEFLKNNYGYITTSEFLNLGISKPFVEPTNKSQKIIRKALRKHNLI